MGRRRAPTMGARPCYVKWTKVIVLRGPLHLEPQRQQVTSVQFPDYEHSILPCRYKVRMHHGGCVQQRWCTRPARCCETAAQPPREIKDLAVPIRPLRLAPRLLTATQNLGRRFLIP